MKHTIESLRQKKFNHLSVIEELDHVTTSSGGKLRTVLCQCKCGNKRRILLVKLIEGRRFSCGCVKRSKFSETTKTNNATIIENTPEHETWMSIRGRCFNPSNKAYKNYGGRGITMCKEWVESFDRFLLDMGKRPSDKHSIDRIDNNGNYEPSNCRWATIDIQSRNRRNNVMLTFNGMSMIAADWAKNTGLSESCIRCRIRSGWSVEKALTTPVRKKQNK